MYGQKSDSNYFKYDRNSLNAKKLNTGDTLILPISFLPYDLIEYKSIVNIYYNGNNQKSFNLKGTGVVPKIFTENYSFGKTNIDEFINPQKIEIEIKNLKDPEWQYYDTLKIFGFKEENIATDITNWNDGMPFRYDKSKINFPIILAPGEEFDFEAEFVARKEGETKGYLTILSDAINDTIVSEWVGYDSSYVDVNENTHQDNISVYPNPANDILLIEFNNQSGISDCKNVKIYDVLGNKLIVNPIGKIELQSNEPLQIDISKLNNGVYYLVLTDINNYVRKPFSVIR
jgi:hypothetical protein